MALPCISLQELYCEPEFAFNTKAAISGGLVSSPMNFNQLFSLLARFHDMNSPIVEPAPDDVLAAGAL